MLLFVYGAFKKMSFSMFQIQNSWVCRTGQSHSDTSAINLKVHDELMRLEKERTLFQAEICWGLISSVDEHALGEWSGMMDVKIIHYSFIVHELPEEQCISKAVCHRKHSPGLLMTTYRETTCIHLFCEYSSCSNDVIFINSALMQHNHPPTPTPPPSNKSQ